MDLINVAEEEIDEHFRDTPIKKLGRYQSIVSVVLESQIAYSLFKASGFTDTEFSIASDNLTACLNFQIRCCKEYFSITNDKLKFQIDEETFQNAIEWREKAMAYNTFCLMFPMHHKKKVQLKVIEGNNLIAQRANIDYAYEYYNRIHNYRHPETSVILDPNSIYTDVRNNIFESSGLYFVRFNPKLYTVIEKNMSGFFRARAFLPDHWTFSEFSLSEFRCVYKVLQVFSYCHLLLCQILVRNPESTDKISPLLFDKNELISRTCRYSGVSKEQVNKVISYLIFGNCGNRSADISLQPIIDLGPNGYLLPANVILDSNNERNLCVLLNRIEADRRIYMRLVEEKEAHLRKKIIESISVLGISYEYGAIENSDLDLALIDKERKICLFLELKWFIEPSEPRELIERSEEILKGINQVKNIINLWKTNKSDIIHNKFFIDDSYTCYGVVASVCFIGTPDIQDSNVPVVNVWHLIKVLNELNCLESTMNWLRSRGYLPVENVDFQRTPIIEKFGKWVGTWYGFKEVNK